MSDDKTNTGARDRSTVSATEDYEVEAFAQEYGITPERVRAMIARHHGNREKMVAEIAAKG